MAILAFGNNVEITYQDEKGELRIENGKLVSIEGKPDPSFLLRFRAKKDVSLSPAIRGQPNVSKDSESLIDSPVARKTQKVPEKRGPKRKSTLKKSRIR